MSDEMDGLAWVMTFDCLGEDLGSVLRTACSWYTGDEDLCAVFFEDLFDTPPMRKLYGGHCGADDDGIESE